MSFFRRDDVINVARVGTKRETGVGVIAGHVAEMTAVVLVVRAHVIVAGLVGGAKTVQQRSQLVA